MSALSGLSSLRLTNDKPQLSCLEPPTWCVTQPHLEGLAGFDISPPAKSILRLPCPSKKKTKTKQQPRWVTENLLGFYTVKQFYVFVFLFYVQLFLLLADYRLANNVCLRPRQTVWL